MYVREVLFVHQHNHFERNELKNVENVQILVPSRLTNFFNDLWKFIDLTREQKKTTTTTLNSSWKKINQMDTFLSSWFAINLKI